MTQPPASARSSAAPPSGQQPGMPPRGKYRPYRSYLPVDLPDRKWPDATIDQAPIWCSVDLRDGNQALINPMDLGRKLQLFGLLVDVGFKQIEVGFPSANDVEFGFTRHLIEQQCIPDDVVIQVLTQARARLIRKTFEAVKGAATAIVHVYNPTSELQRRVVYRTDARGVRNTAVEAVRLIRELSQRTDTEILLEYSPESFTGTELQVALDVCNAVVDAWEPSDERRLILNLPATVEMATPNVYADQIEWFCRHINRREALWISLHTHNDRGTGVAASELGLMAGADRIEGTLFGNGERTGNVDVVTLALNMFSQGVDPQLDFSNIEYIAEVACRCTQLPIHERHPYAGKLVFTAFSGSHQFAIDRGLTAQSLAPQTLWEVPYLPIDPGDVGRDYTADAIRINNQSGGYGVAHVLRVRYDWHVPKELSREFTTQVVKPQGSRDITENLGEAFHEEYFQGDTPYRFIDLKVAPLPDEADQVACTLLVESHGERLELTGRGASALAGCRQALLSSRCDEFEVVSCHKHSTNLDAEPQAIAYVQIETEGRKRRFGAGIDPNANKAAAKALLSALNRVHEHRIYRRPEFRAALESEYHCRIPGDMRDEFERVMDTVFDRSQSEIPAEKIWEGFYREFVAPAQPFEFAAVRYASSGKGAAKKIECRLTLNIDGQPRELVGSGGGTIEACAAALRGSGCPPFEIDGYHAYSLGGTSDAQGITFVNVKVEGRGHRFGAGIDGDTSVADAKALVSALNRTLMAAHDYQPEQFIDLMRVEFRCELPQDMYHEFAALMHGRFDRGESPLAADQVWQVFREEFVDRGLPYAYRDFQWQQAEDGSGRVECQLSVGYDSDELVLAGSGVGIVDACKDALLRGTSAGRAKCPAFRLLDYEEHSLGSGTDALAIAYIPIDLEGRGTKYGVGIDRDVATARIKALLGAVNRSFRKLEYCEHEFFEAMRTEFGCELPEDMYADFTDAMKAIVPTTGDAVSTAELWDHFAGEYLRRDHPYQLIKSVNSSDAQDSDVELCQLTVDVHGARQTHCGRGRNVIGACQDALREVGCPEFDVLYYGAHALRTGVNAESVAYVQIDVPGGGRMFGVGMGPNSDTATIKAVISALNRVAAHTATVLA